TTPPASPSWPARTKTPRDGCERCTRSGSKPPGNRPAREAFDPTGTAGGERRPSAAAPGGLACLRRADRGRAARDRPDRAVHAGGLVQPADCLRHRPVGDHCGAPVEDGMAPISRGPGPPSSGMGGRGLGGDAPGRRGRHRVGGQRQLAAQISGADVRVTKPLIDSLPRPPGATVLNEQPGLADTESISEEIKAKDLNAVIPFYKVQLAKSGWVEDASSASTTTARFVKGTFIVSIDLDPSSGSYALTVDRINPNLLGSPSASPASSP